ncbi:hypothetical protein SAMN02799631_03922 [Methylobacterium sp. 174MFSha1.1]|uniref:hypothetical protein n=1 Tax=Methylobacterium sp. 174MFSha1.1 TaxID=1502749 RepID=UPI0008E4DC56|nr:hypothetical protein [Methylobacterium sp. 174MFSha1.1]SFV02387.1 hypothetical protein SAMN02799631_03922 [Methylobacterium sp. 174MFSha1.1]
MKEETSTDPVSTEAVRRSLDGCLRAPAFRRSQKLAAFLSYIVDEELAGRGEAIKAYTIATQALGRADSFDPSNDPSVRVEAGRLRRVLDEVYADEGRFWPVRIQVPVGAYRPSFDIQEFRPRDFTAEEPGPDDPRAADIGPGDVAASPRAGARPAGTPAGPGSGPGTTAGLAARNVVAQVLALFDTRGQAVLALLLTVIALLLAVEVALQIYVLAHA